jgi:putative transcriptional regulator
MIQHIDPPHAQLRSPLWHGRVVLGRFVLTLTLQRGDQQKRQKRVVHNRLASLRRERGLSYKELADLLSIRPSTLVAVEEGRYLPSMRLALDLSAFFDVPIEALFYSAETEYCIDTHVL